MLPHPIQILHAEVYICAMEELDEIIVLRSFENTIEANLAKTKLDAYNIRCFLTEENIAGLYAVQSFRLFGVRLHIFKHDEAKAIAILSETNPHVDVETCPVCHSDRVEIEYS